MIEASGLEEVPEAFIVSTCGSGHSCLGKRREIEQAGLKARLTEKRKMIIAPLCKLHEPKKDGVV